MGLGWRGDDVVLVPAFVGLFGGMVQEPMVVVMVVGPALTTIFGGRVFGPSPRGFMVVAVGPRLITIFGCRVVGPMPMPMPMPMGGWNFGLRWNARLRSFSFIKSTPAECFR